MNIANRILLCALATTVVGCAPVIQPHVSSSEFLVAGNTIPGKVDLYVSEAFRSYKAEKTDISELKTWKFDLGPVAVDAFRFGLESRFDDVSVKLGDPQFPVDTNGIFYAAVQPSFAQFAASDPVLFKFENYKATVGFSVSVKGADGDMVHSQTYVGEGVKQGSIGYADAGHAAYPIAVQNAVKDAVNKFVFVLVDLSSRADMTAHNRFDATRRDATHARDSCAGRSCPPT